MLGLFWGKFSLVSYKEIWKVWKMILTRPDKMCLRFIWTTDVIRPWSGSICRRIGWAVGQSQKGPEMDGRGRGKIAQCPPTHAEASRDSEASHRKFPEVFDWLGNGEQTQSDMMRALWSFHLDITSLISISDVRVELSYLLLSRLFDRHLVSFLQELFCIQHCPFF